MAHWLEGVGPLLMGLARHGAGFNISLGVNVPDLKRPRVQFQRRALAPGRPSRAGRVPRARDAGQAARHRPAGNRL